jgi:acid phosphatase (class A)
MLRRALLALALALLAALPAAAREPPYLTVQDLDLVAILPPPVVDPEQLALVLAAQRAATPERIEQAKRDVDESPDTMFGAVLGKALDERQLPATARLFARMRDTEDAAVGPAKKAFKRVRPYMSSAEVKPLV